MARYLDPVKAELFSGEIEGTRIRRNAGRIEFEAFNFDLFKGALEGIVSLHPDIPRSHYSGIVGTACSNAAKTGKISAPAVLAALKQQEADFLRKPLRQFYLLSQISIPRTIALPKRTRVRGATVAFTPALRKKEREEQLKFLSKPSAAKGTEHPTEYTFVRTSATGRTEHASGERALDDLDLLRSFWNFGLNVGTRSRLSWPERHEPVNQVLLGPIHTLHEPSGEVAGRTWWYDAAFRPVVQSGDFASTFSRCRDYQRKIVARLTDHPYRDVVESALIRYVRALDLSDAQDAFLRLWSLLETLTAESTHKIVVKRGAALVKPFQVSHHLLDVLRLRRNEHVHLDKRHPNESAAMFNLKFFTERLLRYHIVNQFHFQSIAEAAAFLDHAAAVDQLPTGMKRMRQAAKFFK